MTTLLEIGTAIRAERKRLKLFLKDVAEASGVHRNTLGDLETGKGNVELNTLIAVCEQLGLAIRVVPQGRLAMVGSGDAQQSALSALVDEKLGIAPATK